MAHIYDIGTRAWQPDTTEGWVASEVTDKQIDGDKVTLVFQLENGEVRSPLLELGSIACSSSSSSSGGGSTAAPQEGTIGRQSLTHCTEQDGRDDVVCYPDRQ